MDRHERLLLSVTAMTSTPPESPVRPWPQPTSSTTGMYERKTGLTACAWIPHQEMTVQQWAAAGRRLGAISRASQWWIGDWVRYGNLKWGEKYARAAQLTGYDVASLRNMVWVASQFDLQLREDRLTWSHHALLAALDSDQQRYWLSEAVTRGLSVADLRIELRALRTGRHSASPTRNQRITAARESVICPRCGHKLTRS